MCFSAFFLVPNVLYVWFWRINHDAPFRGRSGITTPSTAWTFIGRLVLKLRKRSSYFVWPLNLSFYNISGCFYFPFPLPQWKWLLFDAFHLLLWSSHHPITCRIPSFYLTQEILSGGSTASNLLHFWRMSCLHFSVFPVKMALLRCLPPSSLALQTSYNLSEALFISKTRDFECWSCHIDPISFSWGCPIGVSLFEFLLRVHHFCGTTMGLYATGSNSFTMCIIFILTICTTFYAAIGVLMAGTCRQGPPSLLFMHKFWSRIVAIRHGHGTTLMVSNPDHCFLLFIVQSIHLILPWPSTS